MNTYQILFMLGFIVGMPLGVAVWLVISMIIDKRRAARRRIG